MPLFPGRQYDIYCGLISSLHQCRDLAQLQHILVEKVCCLVPADSAIFLQIKEDGITVQNSMIWNLNPDLFVQYRDYYQEHDLYKEAVHKLPFPPVVNRCSDFLDYSTWNRNEHRADFLLTQEIYHISCLEILENSHISASISLHRKKHHENFSDREMDILRVLAPTIKTVYQSLTAYPPLVSEALFFYKLTARERQLLPLLMSNIPNEEIAHRLHISHNTVKTHIRHILQKAECTSRFELIVKYGEYQTSRRNLRND